MKISYKNQDSKGKNGSFINRYYSNIVKKEMINTSINEYSCTNVNYEIKANNKK